MAFDIILQKNWSEMNRVSKDIEDILSIQAVLRDESSIIDPSLLIECNIEDIVKCNYVTIPLFGRSYFIKDIISETTDLCRVRCHVDVLSSFASEIVTNRAIINKQEEKWNLYLNDGTFKLYQNPIVLTKAFPSGFSTMEFVLAVAGA